MREWIVTNGLGSYASLTYGNTVTRKYHGLLVASINPPVKRWVFVSSIDDTVQIKDKSYCLRDLESTFTFDGFPSFHYEIDNVKIKKTVLMEHEKNTTLVRYKVETNTPVSFVFKPFLTSRHFYDVYPDQHISFDHSVLEHGMYVKFANVDKTLKIIVRDAVYTPKVTWIDVEYEKDRERNDAYRDRLVCLGELKKNVSSTEEFYIIITIEDEVDANPWTTYRNQLQRKIKLLEQSQLPNIFDKFVLSTDNFIVKRGEGKSIVAGYHWFGDWGRDTLISLPGIALVTKRYDEAKQILFNFSKYCKNGLIPNAFMDRDAVAVYNTVDASLWYVDRVYQYMKYTNDQGFLEDIWGTLTAIIDGYKNGTDFGIHMDSDFLISHGEGLSWMDVKLGDYYPTPRSKKAVEIQALWYNALRIMSVFAQRLQKEDTYASLAENVKKSFLRQYDQRYDVIDTKDAAFRPNQIFLVSLDFSLIDKTLQEKIVSDVQEQLLTIFGLRTLSPRDSRYKGTYVGPYHRDLSYHNGIVWPWLLGPFLTAFMKVKNHESTWKEYAYKQFLQPMMDIYGDEWDGSIYEIFDGDPPFLPQGCITQAWSVAEILRAWVEDVEHIRPLYEKQLFSLDEIRV